MRESEAIKAAQEASLAEANARAATAEAQHKVCVYTCVCLCARGVYVLAGVRSVCAHVLGVCGEICGGVFVRANIYSCMWRLLSS
jgi:hypothetical protein